MSNLDNNSEENNEEILEETSEENNEEILEETSEETSEEDQEEEVSEEIDEISEEDIKEDDIESTEVSSEEIPEEDIKEDDIESIEVSPEEISEEDIKEDDIESIEVSPEEISEERPIETDGEAVVNGETQPQENGLSQEESIVAEDTEVIEESEEEKLAREERQIRDFHRNEIEAALYAAGKPLSIEDLSTKLEIRKKEAEELINELAFDYLDRSTALVIAQMGDRYQMQIKPEYTEKVSKFAKGGAIAEKYLRTLTIIALKQPIMKSMVIKLRGSGAYEHVKYLLENALIEAKKKGRSHELSTTDKYAEMFGLPKDKEEMKRTMIAQLGLDGE